MAGLFFSKLKNKLKTMPDTARRKLLRTCASTMFCK